MKDILIRIDEPIAISAVAARGLLAQDNGDAALLYLALLRTHGDIDTIELKWDAQRLKAAETVLIDLKLIAYNPQKFSMPLPARSDEAPSYTTEDIIHRQEKDGEFRQLVNEVENCMGRQLTQPDIKILLGLYDDAGLPANVIYLLVSHCIERMSAKYGRGRRPTFRQIEKEGYRWKNKNLYTLEAAEKYLKQYKDWQTEILQYMQALQMGNRKPVNDEEKYLYEWKEMGFPSETVALAYEKTVFNCHEFKWSYCDAILRRWHQCNLHTPEEVEENNNQHSEEYKQRQTESIRDREVLKYMIEMQRKRG